MMRDEHWLVQPMQKLMIGIAEADSIEVSAGYSTEDAFQAIGSFDGVHCHQWGPKQFACAACPIKQTRQLGG